MLFSYPRWTPVSSPALSWAQFWRVFIRHDIVKSEMAYNVRVRGPVWHQHSTLLSINSSCHSGPLWMWNSNIMTSRGIWLFQFIKCNQVLYITPPPNYQKSNSAFQDWANHHTKRGSKKCSLLVCKIKKTETYSFLILSTSVYRVPTVGQVLCFLLVPTSFFRAWIGDVITTNVV